MTNLQVGDRVEVLADLTLHWVYQNRKVTFTGWIGEVINIKLEDDTPKMEVWFMHNNGRWWFTLDEIGKI